MSFKTREWLAKRAQKKTDVHAPVQTRLRSEKPINDEPNTLTENQIDNDEGSADNITEKKLDKLRSGAGEDDGLTEARLDASSSNLVKHRNPSAYEGDVPKLEEARSGADDAQEKEKYETSSKTDSSFVVPEIKGKDGIKTAQYSQNLLVDSPEDENPGDPDSEGFSWNIEDKSRGGPVIEDAELDATTKEIVDEETGSLEDDYDPTIARGEQGFEKLGFSEAFQGEQKAYQVEYGFDPMAFTDPGEVTRLLGQKFSADYPQAPAKDLDNMTVVDMDEGKATITFPA